MRENYKPSPINIRSFTVNGKLIIRCAFMLILLCSLLFSFSANAQKVSLIASRYKILIGEQVTLQLKAEGINTAKTFLQNWFTIADTANHLQVTERSTIDTIEINGLTTYLQKINITSFDSGNWKLPVMKLLLQERTTGKQIILQTDSLSIEVLPVDVSALIDYHEI
ncbi:MAG TPA: hypothetical protein PLA68_13830, partial [Panacibacter sp.]|nr:hypothetical protein [Panacibacter sp.]